MTKGQPTMGTEHIPMTCNPPPCPGETGTQIGALDVFLSIPRSPFIFQLPKRHVNPLSARDLRDTGTFKPHSCPQLLSAGVQLCDPCRARAAPSACVVISDNQQTAQICHKTTAWHQALGTALPFCQTSQMSDKGCWTERKLWHLWRFLWLVTC